MQRIQLSPSIGSPPPPSGDLEDEEGLKHLQQVWGCLGKQSVIAHLSPSLTTHSRFCLVCDPALFTHASPVFPH